MSLPKTLIKTCINVASLARKMQISHALFNHRFAIQKPNYDNLVGLTKALDALIFELVTIREDVSKQAWELKQQLINKLNEK
jgi:hypothetical protein